MAGTDRNVAEDQSGGSVVYSSALKDIDHRIANYTKGNKLLLAWTVGAASLVTITCGFVDFFLLKEFWTSIYADQYGEVPPDFADAVFFKSAQAFVLIAASHVVYENLPSWGKKIYKLTFLPLFVLTAVAFGILVGTQIPLGQAEGQAASEAIRATAGQMTGDATSPEPRSEMEIIAETKRPQANQAIYENFLASFYDRTVAMPLIVGLLMLASSGVGGLMSYIAVTAFTRMLGRVVFTPEEERDLRKLKQEREKIIRDQPKIANQNGPHRPSTTAPATETEPRPGRIA